MHSSYSLLRPCTFINPKLSTILSTLQLFQVTLHRHYCSPNLPSSPAFCFDIDGVLKQGSYVLPQAKKILQFLSGHNPSQTRFPVILCTNGGGVSELERCKRLSQEFEITISPNQLVQSHTIFTQFLGLYRDQPILVIGGRGQECRLVAQGYGFQHVYIPQDIVNWNPSIWPFHKLSEQELQSNLAADFSKIAFKAIFVIHDSFDWGLDIQVAVDVLTSVNGVITHPNKSQDSTETVPIYFSNPDILWGNEFSRPRFGQGAFQTALRANYKEVTGRPLEAWTGGKPSHFTYDFANQLLHKVVENDFKGVQLGKVYMIGDNPASDIQGANNYGWSSILVKTGVFKGDKPQDAAFVPMTVQNDVLEGVKWALTQEGYNSSL